MKCARRHPHRLRPLQSAFFKLSHGQKLGMAEKISTLANSETNVLAHAPMNPDNKPRSRSDRHPTWMVLFHRLAFLLCGILGMLSAEAAPGAVDPATD